MANSKTKLVMLETALEVFKICQSAGLDKWVPLRIFTSYSSAGKNTVVNVLDRLSREGFIRRRKHSTGGVKIVKNPTVYEMYDLFAPAQLPPTYPSCNSIVRNLHRNIRKNMKKKTILE